MISKGLTTGCSSLINQLCGTTTVSDAGENAGDFHYFSPYTGSYYQWVNRNPDSNPIYEDIPKNDKSGGQSVMGEYKETNKMEVELCLCSKHLWKN